MDRESPFQILSLHEFDGLSLDEKLAYLDLQLTSLCGEGSRERQPDWSAADEQAEADAVVH